MTDRYLSLREVAMELRVSHETARTAVLDGHIKAVQVRGPGSTWRVEAKDFRVFKMAGRHGDGSVNEPEDNSDDFKTG